MTWGKLDPVGRTTLQGCLALIAAVVALLAPAIFTSRVLAPEDNIYFEPPFERTAAAQHVTRPSNPFLFDQYRQFHPDMLLARQELHAGHLPGWSPFAGAGDPVWASEQHGVASPFEWLAMVLPFWQSLEWVAALKLIAAAIGMFLLLRRLGRSELASVFGGLAFGLCSPLIDWLGHPHTNSYVLLPWLFLATELVATRGRWRDVALLAGVTAACVAGGHPPSAVMVAYMAAAWAVFRFASNPHRRRIASFAGGVILGVGLAAVALVPTIELASHAGTAERGSQGPFSTLYSFVFPDYWGRPDRIELPGGPINYVERTGYFGVIPLLIGLVGLVVQRPRRVQVFFAGLTLVSLLLAVKTPLSSLAIHLPLMSRLGLVRWVLGAAFGGAVLAAFGLDALLERRPSRRAIATAAVATVLPVVAVAAGPGLIHLGQARGMAVLHWAVVGLATTGIAIAMRHLDARRTRLAFVLVLATGLELVAYNMGFQPAIPRNVADPPMVPAIAYARAHVGHARVGGSEALGPNLAARFGLRDARIYRSPPLKRRERLWTALGGSGTDYALLTASAPRLADLFGVKYVFVADPHAAASRHFRAVPGIDGLLDNTGAFPRAWLAYQWRSARDDDHALALVERYRDLEAQPVIETPERPKGSATAPAPVQFVRDGLREVSLRVRATRPGQLVLADSFYPGWKAYVDGRRAPIRPANVAFRAVAVPAGRHTVRFNYEPATLPLGLWISTGTALLIALASIPAARRWLRGAPPPRRHTAA